MNTRHHATVAFVTVTDLIRDKTLDWRSENNNEDLKLHMLDNEQFVISTREAVIKDNDIIYFLMII